MRANKKGKQYRYYVSRKIVGGRKQKSSVAVRIPSHEIEILVLDALSAEMKDVVKLSSMLGMDAESDCVMLESISEGISSIPNLHTVLQRVTVEAENLVVEICLKKLIERLNDIARLGAQAENEGHIYRFVIPYHTRQARKGTVVVRLGNGSGPLDLPKSKLESLVKGTIWRDEHFAGKSFVEIAREHQCSRSYVIQLIDQSLHIR